MATVIMKDWQEGMLKISLSRLQKDLLKISLKEAKHNVDLLLDGKEIRIEIEDEGLAIKFFKEAEKLGAICCLEL